MRLEGDDAAEGAFGEQLFYGEEVAVPAAVVEGNGEHAFALRDAAELESLFAGRGEGLVDDDVLAGFEDAFRQREVRLVGRGDDDELRWTCRRACRRANAQILTLG